MGPERFRWRTGWPARQGTRTRRNPSRARVDDQWVDVNRLTQQRFGDSDRNDQSNTTVEVAFSGRTWRNRVVNRVPRERAIRLLWLTILAATKNGRLRKNGIPPVPLGLQTKQWWQTPSLVSTRGTRTVAVEERLGCSFAQEPRTCPIEFQDFAIEHALVTGGAATGPIKQNHYGNFPHGVVDYSTSELAEFSKRIGL